MREGQRRWYAPVVRGRQEDFGGKGWATHPTKRNSLFFLLVFSSIWLLSCGLCDDTLRSKALSADGRLVANVYERNCGATTDFITIVNVQGTSDKFDGNEGPLFSAKGRYELSVAWTGPRTLLITCAKCSRKYVLREVIIQGGIDVKYSLGSEQ